MINNSSSVALFQVRDDGIFSVPGIAGGSLASLTADVKSTGFRLASGGTYAFSNSATDAYNNAVDTGLSRIAAGVVGVGNGIATSPTGTLVAGNLSVGSTTSWGLLSVAAQAPGSQSPLFVVASSTPSATTTAFIITASNQVGIGNSAPWSALSVTGGVDATASSTIGDSTQGGGFTVNGGATTTGNAYFGGSVGIGTTTPFALLSIAGSSGGSTNLVSISRLIPLTQVALDVVSMIGLPFFGSAEDQFGWREGAHLRNFNRNFLTMRVARHS